MDLRKEDTSLIKKSQAKDINAIIAQRDELLEMLIQRDMTIERLLSEGKGTDDKENVEAIPKKQQSDDKSSESDLVPSDSGRLSDPETTLQTKWIEQPSPTKVEYEEMRLECSLLKDINESLMEDNESLKMVNRILQSNYDILRDRLDSIQREHQLRLHQLLHANEVINKSLKNARTKKRVRSDQHDDHLESPGAYNKRRRFADKESDNSVRNRNGPLEIDVNIECSSDFSGSNFIDSNSNGTEELERNDLEDDLEFIPTEQIFIDLDDISDGEDDCEADHGSGDCKSNNNSTDGDTTVDEDSLGECNFIKPLSQYSTVRQATQTTADEPPKRGE